MKFYTYIMYSESSDMFYQGQTSYIDDQIRRHNTGLIPATKQDAPWELLWLTEKGTRAESLKLEKVIRNLSKKRLVAFMVRYEESVQNAETLALLKKLSNYN